MWYLQTVRTVNVTDSWLTLLGQERFYDGACMSRHSPTFPVTVSHLHVWTRCMCHGPVPLLPESFLIHTVEGLCCVHWQQDNTNHSTFCSPLVTICTAQWSLYVPHSGHYMYHQFNIQQFHVLPTQCIYVFSVDLRTNSDYFPIQH